MQTDSSFFDQEMQEAKVTDPSRCVFVDDSINNIKAAMQFGWTTMFVNEDGIEVSSEMSIYRANSSIGRYFTKEKYCFNYGNCIHNKIAYISNKSICCFNGMNLFWVHMK